MNRTFAKFTLAALVTLGTLTAAPTRQAPDPQRQLTHLTKKLALTADQQSQILPVLTSRQTEAAAINGDTTLSPKQRNAKLQALRSDAESRVRNILTDNQRTAYDQMQQDARDRAKARRLTNTTARAQ